MSSGRPCQRVRGAGVCVRVRVRVRMRVCGQGRAGLCHARAHRRCFGAAKEAARPPDVPARRTLLRAGGGGRYMDPITKDTLTQASKLVVLAPTGERTCV